jgi:quercetin dioxygenase-like cupin family protein
MNTIPFQTIDWTSVNKEEYAGKTGIAEQQTIEFNGLRLRLVTFSSGYLADHWCQKGHIVHCLEGEFITELKTGEKVKLQKGETYIVSDDASSHLSICEIGVKLLIIDCHFLK